MTRARLALGVAIIVFVATLQLAAVTRLKSADGQFWDIQDTSPWAQDSGGIATGGRANPFNGFGYLKLQVRRPDGVGPRAQPLPDGVRTRARRRRAVRFDHAGAPGRASSSRARSSRRTTRTTSATSTRYTNVTRRGPRGRGGVGRRRGRLRGWRAGDGGDDVERRPAHRAGRRVRHRHAERTRRRTIRCAGRPATGRRRTCWVREQRDVLVSVGDMYARSVHRALARLRSRAHRLRLPLHREAWPDDRAGDLRRQGTERGLRSARRLPRADSQRHGRAAVRGRRTRARTPVIPAAGSEIARVTAVARQLVAEPDFRGLTPRELGADRQLAASAGAAPAAAFTVFEQTADLLQDALTRGDGHVGRPRARVPDAPGAPTIGTVRRSARCWRSTRARSRTRGRSMPSGRPAACAARSTASRSCSRTTSTSWGCRPPAARGRWSDHRPRLDSCMAAGMRRAGAVVLGKTNLDEFPFGDFGISTVGGTIGNAYDPVAQHGGLERRQRRGGVDQPRDARASAPTRATRCRTRRRSRRSRRSAPRAA